MAIRYAIEGDLRFISHHDTLRVFERAFARAVLPVRFSQGFNPRPRLSIPLPRPVGVASCDEWVVVELTQPVEVSEVQRRLETQFPPGMKLLDAELLAGTARRRPWEVTYSIDIASEAAPVVARRVAEFLSQPHFFVERTVPGTRGTRKVDLRASVARADVTDGRLRWTQVIEAGAAARPNELLEAFGLPPADHLHRLRRIRVAHRAEAAQTCPDPDVPAKGTT